MEKIDALVYEWDPLGLSGLAPKEEYVKESQLIMRDAQSAENANRLGEQIFNIFVDRFGQSGFSKSREDCVMLAKAILELKRSG
jgi:hypothetical protein